jgi:hypothetical protein
MSAPSPTTRTTPTGYRMDEGFKAKLTFSLKPTLKIWEVEVGPPSVTGGPAIKTTTQHNVAWHTKAPQTLKEAGPVSVLATYDPDELPFIYSMVNVPQTITVLHPDSSTDAFFAYLKDAKPSKYKIGDLPTLDLEIEITNWDPVGKVEAGPVHTYSAGTA